MLAGALPAIHGEQSVSFVLEWNGLKFAFSSDTLPTKWWREHTKGADLSIHECFTPLRCQPMTRRHVCLEQCSNGDSVRS